MLNCIIIDDEPLAIDLIEDYINNIPFLNLIDKFQNPIEAINSINPEKVDLIFLDIEMPGISGIDFMESLEFNPMVIFISAYQQYAIEGFNLNVIDYLLKPVEFSRFLKASNKAKNQQEIKNSEASKNKSFLFVNSEYSIVKVFLSDIVYIEGLKDYVKIHTANSSKALITKISLKKIEESLNSNQFIRIHKSYIVSLDKIQHIRNNKIHMTKAQLPLSLTYKDDFLNKISAIGIKI